MYRLVKQEMRITNEQTAEKDGMLALIAHDSRLNASVERK